MKLNRLIFVFAMMVPAMAQAENCNEADRLFNSSLKESTGQESLLRQAIKVCPVHVDALNNLAVLLERQGKLEEARKLYDDLTNKQPDFAPGYAGLGDVLAAMGKFTAASWVYNSFLDLLTAELQAQRPSPYQKHRATYQTKLAEVQRRIQPETVVAANDVGSFLNASAVTVRGKRGKRELVRAPQVEIALNFVPGSGEMTQTTRAQLEQLAQALTAPKLVKSRFRIEGHVDPADGIPDEQQVRSLSHAEQVRKVLTTQYQIAEERLEVAGQGGKRPFSQERNVHSQALNRRVTIIHLGDGA
ncbi:MAG: OmpA family protein [Magnetococcales bacterium]|nr:OmpA family protein [Magnetococcales bacterium]